MAEARKQILESVISYVDPDVMILHETIKSIDGFFEDTGIPQKDYNYMAAENEQEARVIYKKKPIWESRSITCEPRYSSQRDNP